MEARPATTNGGRVEALAELANEAGATGVAADARALAERLVDGLFYVACLGQFKRGKSSLLNALVGHAILPVGVVPVTAVITVVRHGPQPAARVRFADGGWREIDASNLERYVAEQHNPENRKGVAAVEVFAPSPLLASGMCLVDTPGIGSVFDGNTQATRNFVPHVDAGLVVLGADPPISADELALIAETVGHCRELFFVLNKSDKLTEAECKEASAFTRQVLASRLGLREIRLFEVSAMEQMAGKGPARGWSALLDALQELALRSGGALVQAAEERGLALLAGRLSRRLDEETGALLRPLEESQQRVEALRACLAEAERSLDDLAYLFKAEEEKLARAFARNKNEFLETALREAREELAAACRPEAAGRGPALRRASVQMAQAIATRRLDAWLAVAEPAAEALYTSAMDRFVELSNGFLDRLRSSGDPALAQLPAAVDRETGFRWDSKLFYKDLWQSTGEGPLVWCADLLRPKRMLLRSIERRTGEYLHDLLAANATRIENDLNDRVVESRRRFQFEIRSLLEEVLSSAADSLQRARLLHARGDQAVQEEKQRLNALSARLQALAIT